MSEGVILAQCLEWLALRRVFCWRNNTGCYRTATGAFVRYGHPGSGDILGLLPDGRFLSVECKTATGTQRKNQRLFQKMVEKNGGVYVVARGTTDLERAIGQLPGLAAVGPDVGRRDGTD